MALFISLFAAFMIIGTLVGVLMLIPSKTRKTGLRLALFCIITLLSIALINKFFLKYENEPVATITPEEYKKIKEGMTYDEVKKIVGGKAKSEYKINKYSSPDYDFDGEGGLENDATVSLHFVDGKLSVKSEYGLITKSDQSELDNSPYVDVTDNPENKIRELVNEHLHNVSVEDIEVNQDLGTEKKDQLIALVHLSFDLKNSSETTKNMIELYSEDLAARLAEEDTSVSELSVFWKAPYIDEDETLAKFSYKRSGEKMVTSARNVSQLLN
ncbi:hypothetical protein C3438_12880 [Bacillus velezensis]|uniref:Uncharacterized protein n=2 Tax=Bacillus glycinifermentans TaxID=1664069 RepID=A0AAJ4D176_9BACI|nr:MULTISPECIES: hypothetical protein [Bacillus]AVB10320.1 hypothetical protein C3438_12880 [Bacillus velezensis]QAT64108.1 hypothetical protein EQZ20_03695 [Bacillus glycinifermentans]